MFEFLNPGFLAAGAALVSAPIIIHLINRLRFKRVRWAAMEFLLKSQKRNRRRLIIEQLILLALRCLLVLLAVLLVARYLGFNFALLPQQSTTHVVVLDDSLSMTDRWKDRSAATRDAFKAAKELVAQKVAKNAAQARTAQRLVLLQLSDLATVRFDQRLNDATLQDLQRTLDDLAPSALRLELTQGVEAARAVFDRVPQDRKLLHLVSDFRRRDWNEPDSAGLTKSLEALAPANVQVHLLDAADPTRTESSRTVLAHDNLGIVELKPETRIAAKDMPVQFSVAVANFGSAERKNVRVTVKVNGRDRPEGSVILQDKDGRGVQPGETKTERFTISFDQLGFNQVSVNLEGQLEEAGLAGDNVRYAVVETRKQVPVLAVDGDLTRGLRPGGDTFHLQALFTAAKGYQVVARGPAELEQPNLDQYPAIYLLNVRELTPKAQANLEGYVREGGSVAFFLGENSRPEFYNRLYAAGKGLFPAPLADRTYPPLSDRELQPDLFDFQPKIFLREEKHPLLAEVYPYRHAFKFLPIRRYWPVSRRDWQPEPGQVEELITLPNHNSVQDYAGRATSLLETLEALENNPKYADYQASLKAHRNAILATLVNKPLYELANALEAILNDKGEPAEEGAPRRPNLREKFWSEPEVQALRARFERFREEVQLGDPLVVSRAYGRGRCVAFLTTFGRAWNDGAGGSFASGHYVTVLLELQKYLTSSGAENQLTVGTPLEIALDTTRYKAEMHRYYKPELAEGDGANAGLQDLKVQKGEVNGTSVSFVFDQGKKPGAYLFDLERYAEAGNEAGPTRTEQRAYAFNVDPREMALARAARDDLERTAPGSKLWTPDMNFGELANRQNDFSESPWLYLLFLAILVCEQALAVHLSFHLKGNESAAATVQASKQTAAAA